MYSSKANQISTPNPLGDSKTSFMDQSNSAEDHFVSQFNANEDKGYQEDVIMRFYKILKTGYEKSRIIYQIAISPLMMYKYTSFQYVTKLVLIDNLHQGEIRKCFTVKYFRELIENCDQLEVIGLALQLYNTLQIPYLNTNISQRENQQFKDEVVELLDQKIETFVTVNELDKYLLTDILGTLAEQKCNQQGVQKIRLQDVKDLISKIYTIIDEIFFFNPDKLQSIPNYLLIILLKWVLILPSMSDIEIKYVQKVIQLITQKVLISEVDKYDVPKLTNLFLFIFKSMKIPWDNKDPIRPNQNLHALLEGISSDILHKYFQEFSFDIIHLFFNPNDTLTILNNLIDCGYTFEICNLIWNIIKALSNIRRFDVIQVVHSEFIMKRLINKIQCKNCILPTIGLIKETLFGLAKKTCLTDNQAQTLVKQFKFVMKFKSVINKDDIQYLYKFFYLLSNNQDVLKGLNTQSISTIKEIVNQGFEIKIIDQNDYQLRQKVEDMKRVYIMGDNRIQPSQQLSGLLNMGNTCYINSFVHSLYHAKAFREFILYYKPTLDISKVFSSFVDPIEEIMKIFLKMYSQPMQQDIDAKQLKLSLPEPFRSSMEQQDSGEFGRMYLDYIQNYLKDTEYREEIDKFFFGKIENITQCQSCKKSYKKIEKMLDIYVNFCEQAYIKERKTYDLIQMIKNSFQAETFDENNAYFCENCNKKTSAIKQTQVKMLPPYLTISIGRFQYDKQRQERVKLLDPINLPQSFNIQDIFENAQIPQNLLFNFDYQLYAFIVHLGSQIDAGHYIAYGRNLENNNNSSSNNNQQWKLYDDNLVIEQIYSADELVQNFAESETPYMLFYANKNHQPIELHKYIRSKSQIYQNMGSLQESFNIQEAPTNGYFFNNQSSSNNNNIMDQSSSNNRFQNNFKK